ncbi:hypothetical protein Cadr_000016488 [Camelus dromedarius]|uniref:Protein phosphatase 1 regulatory subunit 26 N-terminal domain-containing protein n=1 Tax=Camelus dromedarius TaxID=9838 RepID=A0A5N4EAC5_CAMDR|nr:hypothetical protein Cadr_000016488 [Camelus dromedarius]
MSAAPPPARPAPATRPLVDATSSHSGTPQPALARSGQRPGLARLPSMDRFCAAAMTSFRNEHPAETRNRFLKAIKAADTERRPPLRRQTAEPTPAAPLLTEHQPPATAQARRVRRPSREPAVRQGTPARTMSRHLYRVCLPGNLPGPQSPRSPPSLQFHRGRLARGSPSKGGEGEEESQWPPQWCETTDSSSDDGNRGGQPLRPAADPPQGDHRAVGGRGPGHPSTRCLAGSPQESPGNEEAPTPGGLDPYHPSKPPQWKSTAPAPPVHASSKATLWTGPHLTADTPTELIGIDRPRPPAPPFIPQTLPSALTATAAPWQKFVAGTETCAPTSTEPMAIAPGLRAPAFKTPDLWRAFGRRHGRGPPIGTRENAMAPGRGPGPDRGQGSSAREASEGRQTKGQHSPLQAVARTKGDLVTPGPCEGGRGEGQVDGKGSSEEQEAAQLDSDEDLDTATRTLRCKDPRGWVQKKVRFRPRDEFLDKLGGFPRDWKRQEAHTLKKLSLSKSKKDDRDSPGRPQCPLQGNGREQSQTALATERTTPGSRSRVIAREGTLFSSETEAHELAVQPQAARIQKFQGGGHHSSGTGRHGSQNRHGRKVPTSPARLLPAGARASSQQAEGPRGLGRAFTRPAGAAPAHEQACLLQPWPDAHQPVGEMFMLHKDPEHERGEPVVGGGDGLYGEGASLELTPGPDEAGGPGPLAPTLEALWALSARGAGLQHGEGPRWPEREGVGGQARGSPQPRDGPPAGLPLLPASPRCLPQLFHLWEGHISGGASRPASSVPALSLHLQGPVLLGFQGPRPAKCPVFGALLASKSQGGEKKEGKEGRMKRGPVWGKSYEPQEGMERQRKDTGGRGENRGGHRRQLRRRGKGSTIGSRSLERDRRRERQGGEKEGGGGAWSGEEGGDGRRGGREGTENGRERWRKGRRDGGERGRGGARGEEGGRRGEASIDWGAGRAEDQEALGSDASELSDTSVEEGGQPRARAPSSSWRTGSSVRVPRASDMRVTVRGGGGPEDPSRSSSHKSSDPQTPGVPPAQLCLWGDCWWKTSHVKEPPVPGAPERDSEQCITTRAEESVQSTKAGKANRRPGGVWKSAGAPQAGTQLPPAAHMVNVQPHPPGPGDVVVRAALRQPSGPARVAGCGPGPVGVRARSPMPSARRAARDQLRARAGCPVKRHLHGDGGRLSAAAMGVAHSPLQFRLNSTHGHVTESDAVRAGPVASGLCPGGTQASFSVCHLRVPLGDVIVKRQRLGTVQAVSLSTSAAAHPRLPSLPLSRLPSPVLCCLRATNGQFPGSADKATPHESFGFHTLHSWVTLAHTEPSTVGKGLQWGRRSHRRKDARLCVAALARLLRGSGGEEKRVPGEADERVVKVVCPACIGRGRGGWSPDGTVVTKDPGRARLAAFEGLASSSRKPRTSLSREPACFQRRGQGPSLPEGEGSSGEEGGRVFLREESLLTLLRTCLPQGFPAETTITPGEPGTQSNTSALSAHVHRLRLSSKGLLRSGRHTVSQNLLRFLVPMVTNSLFVTVHFGAETKRQRSQGRQAAAEKTGFRECRVRVGLGGHPAPPGFQDLTAGVPPLGPNFPSENGRHRLRRGDTGQSPWDPGDINRRAGGGQPAGSSRAQGCQKRGIRSLGWRRLTGICYVHGCQPTGSSEAAPRHGPRCEGASRGFPHTRWLGDAYCYRGADPLRLLGGFSLTGTTGTSPPA